MSKHVRKILPLLLCLLLMACLLPAAYADGELKLTWPSKVVVPPTRQDISVRHMVGDYEINQDGILDLLFDGYTISCFYDENGLFSGGNIHWLPNNESGVYYNAWTPDGDLSAVDSYMGSYVLSSVGSDLYRTCDYFFDLDGNVTEVRFLDEDGTDYHWKPAYNGQPAEGWFYYDQKNNFEKVYVDLDKEMRTDEIPGYAIQITNETAKFWVEEALPQETSVDGLLAAIANNKTEYVLNDADEITGTLVIPEGFRLQVNKMLLVNGTGHLTNNGVINLGTSGVLHIGGVFQGNPGSCIEVLNADLANIRPRVIIEKGGKFNGMGGVAISKALLEDYSSGGVDRSQIIDVPNMGAWSEIEAEDAVCYFPGKDIDPAIFQSMCGSGKFSQIRLRGTGDLTLTANLPIPEGFILKVRNDSRLIVPEGKILGVDGEIEISEGGEIYVAGKLETKPHEGAISMYEGGMLRVTGEFNNNNFVVFGKNKLNDKVAPKLIIENGASYKDGGLRVRRNLDVNAVVQGIDMSDYCRHVDHQGPENVYYPGSMLNFEGMFPVGGKNIERLEVHGLDTLTLSSSVEIPVFDDGTAATVDMSETKLVIPSGKTLHVRGELSIKDLVVENGGGLLLHGNGTVAVAGELNNSSAVVVMDNSVLNVSGEMVNRDALRVEGNSSVTVSGKLTNNATIGIGENAQIAVMGVLINNGSIDLMGATDLALVNGGVYSGGGTVTRGGEPYTIWNDPANADIRLPAGLKKLESQALANGDFFSVYIPAGTTTIVSDAFGNKAGMIIYGVPGSEAETFADNNNYLFAPVAPAA